MKYYEIHEPIYQRLNQEGYLSWDRARTRQEMDQHSIQTHWNNLVQGLSLKESGMTVLDLGTGTGNTALFLSERGARCVGVDVSGTAVAMAKKHAEERKLSVEFIEADLLKLSLEQKFDLVMDSSLLHCLVGEESRAAFYRVVQEHLRPQGFLFIHTMIHHPDRNPWFQNENFYFDGKTLWSLGMPEVTEGRIIHDGKSYYPHRTLLSETGQLAELARNGFEPVRYSVHSSAADSDLLVGIFKQP